MPHILVMKFGTVYIIIYTNRVTQSFSFALISILSETLKFSGLFGMFVDFSHDGILF